jgi:hypothetical protein
MKRSLLALVISLAFLVAGAASADMQKPTTDKKASCCAPKSDGAKACARDEKYSCCSKKGEKANACCPGECCGKECSHKDGKEKTAPAAQAKGSGETQKDAACCCGGSCCKAAAA